VSFDIPDLYNGGVARQRIFPELAPSGIEVFITRTPGKFTQDITRTFQEEVCTESLSPFSIFSPLCKGRNIRVPLHCGAFWSSHWRRRREEVGEHCTASRTVSLSGKSLRFYSKWRATSDCGNLNPEIELMASKIGLELGERFPLLERFAKIFGKSR
jgi:hypothetical protein